MRRLLAFTVCTAAAVLALPAPAQAAAPTCFGQKPNVVGTEGPDTIRLRDGIVDIVYGGRGNDSILGPGESGPGADVGDLMCGGPGDDRIFGSVGDDKINGGDGNDDVEGWVGADLVQGNAGDDSVTDESIESNFRSDKDTLRGGVGNDHLAGGLGADRMYGQAGNDRLFDLECDGPTLLAGGAGNDVLESYRSSFEGATCAAGSTPDRLDGGAGRDSAAASRNDRRVAIETVMFPGD